MLKAANRNAKPVASYVDELLRRAYRQSQAGELRSAFRLYLGAAKLGDATAQLSLGYCYDVGIGVMPNRSSAMEWYKRAYRKGYGSAANNIGTIFRDEGDTRKALAWFERAVRLGDIDSNLEIAKILLQEKKHAENAIPYLKCVAMGKPRVDVTESSWDEAVRLLKRACRFSRRSRRSLSSELIRVHAIGLGEAAPCAGFQDEVVGHGQRGKPPATETVPGGLPQPCAQP